LTDRRQELALPIAAWLEASELGWLGWRRGYRYGAEIFDAAVERTEF
jgi:hypothetical protein